MVPVAGGLSPAGIVDGVGESAMRGLTGFVVNGAAWLLSQLATAVTGSTQIRLRSGWFVDHYQVMASIAAARTEYTRSSTARVNKARAISESC